MCGKAGNFRLNKPPQYYGSFPHVNDRLNSFFLKRRAGKSRRRSIILCRRHSFHPSFIRCKVAAQGGEVWTSAACNDRGPATGTLIGVDPSKRIYPAMIGRLCPDPPARRYGGRRRSCFTSTDLPQMAPWTVAKAAFASAPKTVTSYYHRGDSACHEKKLLGPTPLGCGCR